MSDFLLQYEFRGPGEKVLVVPLIQEVCNVWKISFTLIKTKEQ